MKLVIAIIRPERLDAVQDRLRAVLDEDDNYRITVDPVQGHGRQHGDTEYARGQPVQPRLVQKVRVMVAVNDPYLDRTIEAVLAGARIRTGERGPQAI